MKLLGLATYGLYPLGCAITIARTARRQAIHDLAAGSVCVTAVALERVGAVQHVGSVATAPTSGREVDGPDGHRGPFL